jgi:hypothetical protein
VVTGVGVLLCRFSHLITRVGKRDGLRRIDPDDGRCTSAVLTEVGHEHIRKAVPGHVAAVRKWIFDDQGGAFGTRLVPVLRFRGRPRTRCPPSELPDLSTVR